MTKQVRPEIEIHFDITQLSGYDLSDDDKKYLKEVEEKQAKFHLKLENSKKLSPYEKKALECTTIDEFMNFWDEYCQYARSKFSSKHEVGWRRWTKKSQKFANRVRIFMEDMKIALDACKEFGKPWSGLPIGTLAVLFVVGSNRYLMEEQISSALEGIRDRLPGFEMLRQCYTGNDTTLESGLRRNILLAHLSFIELTMEVTNHYLHRGYRRLITAAFHSTKFKELSDKANKRVVAVRIRCEELVNLNISQIKKSNNDFLERLDVLLQGDAHNYISRIQELMKIPAWSLEFFEAEELGSYRRSLQYEAYYEQGVYEQMTYKDINNLGMGDVLTRWSLNGHSSMLILTGVNNSNIMSIKRHCWLSPLAMEISDKERETELPHAFFLFRRPNRKDFKTAIPMIVAQLLRRKGKNSLEPHKIALASHAEAFAHLNADDAEDDKSIDILSQLLYDTIKIFDEKETVTLIIDRLDACEDTQKNEFLRVMTRTINEASCTVKVLVVTQWMNDWRPNERELKGILGADTSLHLETKEQGLLAY
ncbi:hypothetical protein F4774DRAFT_384483 [Daldinia eschscholtzii]|nr:hypothetical protein F4774DRAFT_384483 [Daldinia eschscholtzii]